jgi:tetratricopeptide (TPR) repeat protein
MEAGYIYRDMKRFPEAREVFTGVRALFPGSELPEIALGTVSLHEGDFDAAIRYYNLALEKNPASAYAHAHAGEAHLFRMQKEAAREHRQKAIELDRRGPFGKLARSLMEFADAVRYA